LAHGSLFCELLVRFKGASITNGPASLALASCTFSTINRRLSTLIAQSGNERQIANNQKPETNN